MAEITSPPSPEELLESDDSQVLTHFFQLGGASASDSLDAAYSLLDRCGSLSQVFQLTRSSVDAVPDLAADTAEYISMFAEMMGRYLRPQPINRPRLVTSEAVSQLLTHYFHEHKEETLYMLCLNPSWQLHAGGILSLGGGWQVRLPSRRMLDLALRHNTQGVILAHNHPDGISDFSDTDVQSTQEMSNLLAQVEVSLLDHFLFVGDKVLSMRYKLEFRQGRASPFSPMDRFPRK